MGLSIAWSARKLITIKLVIISLLNLFTGLGLKLLLVSGSVKTLQGFILNALKGFAFDHNKTISV